MQHAEYIHLVRLSEQAFEDDPVAYRRGLQRFAALGYAFAGLLVVVTAALAAWIVHDLLAHGWRPMTGWLLFVEAALLWICLRALGQRSPVPEGYAIDAGDAPDLFKALERMQQAVKAPAIDRVLIDDRFEVAIVQRPRWGLFGHENVLVLGWPLLCSLESRRLFALVAHEVAHLRRKRFAAWVYRTRGAWARMHAAYHGDRSPVSWLLRRFFDGYIPRFSARSFALARHEELEADRIAAKLCTPEVMVAAWNEIAIKQRWHDDEYWKDVWRRAFQQERPDPMPHADMRRRLMRAPADGFAQEALRRALAQRPRHDDTHPPARERLAAMDGEPTVPAWSRKSSVHLLGDAAKRVAAHFDQDWWERVRRDWQRHREHLKRCMERLQALKSRSQQLSADEFVDWADCFEALSADDSSVLYEHALRMNPDHPLALRRLGEVRARSMHPLALDTLDRLQANHPQHGSAACALAHELLDRLEHAGEEVTPAMRKHWRERRENFEVLEQKAADAFAKVDPTEGASAPEWTDAERRRVVDELIRTPEVKAAWVASKQLPEMPRRPYLVLFVELAKRDASLAREVAEKLVAHLPFDGRLRVAVMGVEVRERELETTGAASVYRRQGK